MTPPNEPPSGWYSRGYLPHFDQPNLMQGLTFHLGDAMPQSVLEEWEAELENMGDSERELERRRRIEKYFDAGHGSCILREWPVAALVENALLYFDGQRYALIAWCVMPNHVHALISCHEEWTLASVLHSWKSFTSHELNKLRSTTGSIWQREYHDRFIRDAAHFDNAVRYIERNPVKARLVSAKEDWQWSSAWKGRQ